MAPPSSALVGKIKVQLKLAISRLRMVQQKDEAIAKQQRRAMAQLLEQGKHESARIRVENIIRSDLTSELHEILELYCELLLARAGLLESPTCDPGLEEAVKSIIYAAPRTEIKELQQARALLVERYGKDFATEAMENVDGTHVAERVSRRLRVEPPGAELVEGYLREIARTYGVAYGPRGAGGGGAEDDDEPGDGEKEKLPDEPVAEQPGKAFEAPLEADALARATPPRDIGPKSPVQIAPPSPSTENLSPRLKLPGPPELKPGTRLAGVAGKKSSNGAGGTGSSGAAGGGGGGKEGADSGNAGQASGEKAVAPGKVPDVDDLAKRFALLKR